MCVTFTSLSAHGMLSSSGGWGVGGSGLGQKGGKTKTVSRVSCVSCSLGSEGLVLEIMVDLSLLTPAQKHMLPFTAA